MSIQISLHNILQLLRPTGNRFAGFKGPLYAFVIITEKF